MTFTSFKIEPRLQKHDITQKKMQIVLPSSTHSKSIRQPEWNIAD